MESGRGPSLPLRTAENIFLLAQRLAIQAEKKAACALLMVIGRERERETEGGALRSL